MAFDTNTQTTQAAPINFEADPNAAMAALLGDSLWRIAARLPKEDASVSEIEKSGLFAGCESRVAYLDWVARYKTNINAAADYIRTQKAQRRNPDESTAWSAQSNARTMGEAVTMAITMRRLGKRWSAARAEAARASQVG